MDTVYRGRRAEYHLLYIVLLHKAAEVQCACQVVMVILYGF